MVAGPGLKREVPGDPKAHGHRPGLEARDVNHATPSGSGLGMVEGSESTREAPGDPKTHDHHPGLEARMVNHPLSSGSGLVNAGTAGKAGTASTARTARKAGTAGMAGTAGTASTAGTAGTADEGSGSTQDCSGDPKIHDHCPGPEAGKDVNNPTTTRS